MKLSLKIARILIRLIDGEVIPSSAANNNLIDELVAENIIFRKGRHRRTLELINEEALRLFLANQMQIFNLEDYVAALENEEASRADLVHITSDSKISKERAFQGFLVNSYEPIKAKLNREDFVVHPPKGSFQFIYNYKNFIIPPHITIVGVENAKNFSCIEEQQYLFKEIKPLFISRYPQNQNKDFIKWMKSLPNHYLHFGDFDFAGIGIYLNEYKKHLGIKASFFIPSTIDKDLKERGNRRRYDIQKLNFNLNEIKEPGLSHLMELIRSTRKGLDQEFYIRSNP